MARITTTAALLFASAAALLLLGGCDAALRPTAPRVLRPRQASRPSLLLGTTLGAGLGATVTGDCGQSLRSCADCNSVLTCTKLNDQYLPISNTACPTATPYCSNGQCVATLPATDRCYQRPTVDFTCVGNGYFPSPANCKKYYFCTDNEPYEYDCTGLGNTNYGHARAMCVPTSEASCSVVSCTTANVGRYQTWAQDKSVYFVCTDTTAANAYVADCGRDRQINTTTGNCELACQREGRLADPDDASAYYECVQTATNTFVGPREARCPGNATFDATTERCVSQGGGGGGSSDDDNDHPREELYRPSNSVPESMYNVPDSMLIGSASSAYQVEGAWNVSQKTPNIWDVFFHSRPSSDNGDVACDSYNKWQEDIKLLQSLGMQSYRFSVSWTRVLPQGNQAGGSDPVGVQYYNNLIDGLLAVNITPLVTIFHWEVPQIYQDDGGWLNSAIVDRYLDYADFCFKTFGDRVKTWVLINEPNIFCPFGYDSGYFAPGVTETGTGGYLCVHNQILAHAKAYRLYDSTYRASQQGRVGTAQQAGWAETDGTSAEAEEAAERSRIFTFASFYDPIFTGDYPKVMRDTIDRNSRAEGRTTSRLPYFTEEEKTMIKGATDFIGLNHYQSSLVGPGHAKLTDPGTREKDTNTTSRNRDTWTAKVQPWGLRYLLGWIKDRYNNAPLLIAENGYSGPEDEGTDDPARLGYYSTYMRGVMRAVNQDGCNVFGYTAWSLMDNLEWVSGYKQKYGITYVDFNDPNRTRTLKKSAALFQEVARTRHVPYYEPVLET